VEYIQRGMAEPVAANEVNHQKHEQRAANQNGNSDLQAELKIVQIGNFAHNLGAQAADQLRRKHIHTN